MDVALRGAREQTTNLGDGTMNDAAVYGFRQIAGAMGCKDAQQHTGKSYEQMMAEVEAISKAQDNKLKRKLKEEIVAEAKREAEAKAAHKSQAAPKTVSAEGRRRKQSKFKTIRI